jgi:excisionase family DNA binding protein
MSTILKGSMAVSCQLEPLNYSINDTAILLGISRPTIYRLHRQGVLTIHKFGNKSLITSKDIAACQRKMTDGKLPRKVRS